MLGGNRAGKGNRRSICRLLIDLPTSRRRGSGQELELTVTVLVRDSCVVMLPYSSPTDGATETPKGCVLTAALMYTSTLNVNVTKSGSFWAQHRFQQASKLQSKTSKHLKAHKRGKMGKLLRECLPCSTTPNVCERFQVYKTNQIVDQNTFLTIPQILYVLIRISNAINMLIFFKLFVLQWYRTNSNLVCIVRM